MFALGKIRPKNAINIYDTTFTNFKQKQRYPCMKSQTTTLHPTLLPLPIPTHTHPIPSLQHYLKINKKLVVTFQFWCFLLL